MDPMRRGMTKILNFGNIYKIFRDVKVLSFKK